VSTFSETAPSLLASRYLVGGELGRGGMAIVYRAWDSVLNRDVAVKMLANLVMDATARARFELEGETLAKLNHPGLTMLFDAGTHDDRPYLVMELVQGDTLAELCRQRRLTPGEVAAIGAPLADTLHYVHGCGIVHRDIKPSNVLIGTDQRVRLADFGIARLLDSAVRHTVTGVTVGTAAYLAPEQLRSEPDTNASDIYALGLVLLEAASGTPAFPGAPHVAAVARLTDSPAIDNSLPVPLRTLLSAMTTDPPASRPTAAEVGIRLREIAVALESVSAAAGAGRAAPAETAGTTAERLTATGNTAPQPPARHSHRDRLLVAACAVAAITGALLLASPWGDQRESAEPRLTTPASQGPASDRPTGAPSHAPADARTGAAAAPAQETSAVAGPIVTTSVAGSSAAGTPSPTATATATAKGKGKANAPGQLKKKDKT